MLECVYFHVRFPNFGGDAARSKRCSSHRIFHSLSSPSLLHSTGMFKRCRLKTKMKKVLRGDANTARWQTEPKIFAPLQTPFPGAQDGQNLISWRWSLPLPIQTQFGEDRCTQFRVIVVTDPPTHSPTDRTDYSTLHSAV